MTKWPKLLVIMVDFWVIMTSHDDPKNDQNDQSMSQWFDYYVVMMTQKMTKMTSHYGWLLPYND